MPRTSKPSDDWASLLQRELTTTTRPKNGKTIHELAEMRKKMGLSGGHCTMQRWLAKEVDAGRLSSVTGSERVENRIVRRTFYVPVKP